MRMFRFIYLLIAAFIPVYLAVALSGIFSITSPPFSAVLYSMPINVCSMVVLLAMTFDLLFRPAQPGRSAMAGWIALVAIILLCAGLWIGGLMSYSMRTVITEGQTVSLPDEAALALGGYTGKYARMPRIAVMLEELLPQFNAMGNGLDGLEAKMQVVMDGGVADNISVKKGGTLNPFGVHISIDDFGYSPRYEMHDGRGGMIDSSFVFLKLFPPGQEDYFRLLAPLTYYLRYYPQGDGTDDSDEPILKVRIARNRDIAFNKKVALGQLFSYENARMIFPEIRQWTVLEVSSNPGSPFIWGGAILSLTALAFALFSRRRARK